MYQHSVLSQTCCWERSSQVSGQSTQTPGIEISRPNISAECHFTPRRSFLTSIHSIVSAFQHQKPLSMGTSWMMRRLHFKLDNQPHLYPSISSNRFNLTFSWRKKSVFMWVLNIHCHGPRINHNERRGEMPRLTLKWVAGVRGWCGDRLEIACRLLGGNEAERREYWWGWFQFDQEF